MPCQPSARANHTLLRSCCVNTGCGCETRSTFFSGKYYACKETTIDQPARQITLCDLIISFDGRVMTRNAFLTSLSSALAPICGSINAVITANSSAGSVDVATITNGVVEIGDIAGGNLYNLTVTGNDGCIPSSQIQVQVSIA